MNTEPMPNGFPVQAPVRSPNRTNVISILIVVLVVLLVAAALFFVRIQGDRLGSRIIEAIRLHDVTLVSATDTQPHLYSLGVFGLKDKQVSKDGGQVVEYTKGAFITQDTKAGTEQVVLSSGNKNIGSAAPHIAAVSVSASGDYVAYSVSSSTETQRISAWSMRLHDSAKNRDIQFGIGYGAQFVTHEGKEFLIYTTTNGIQYVALDTLDGFLTPLDMNDLTAYAVKASPDGKYLAIRDRAIREWGIFAIAKLEIGFPIRMTPLHTDLSTLTSVMFTGNRLIGIEPVFTDKTHLQSTAVRIHALPVSKIDTASSTVVYTVPTTSLFAFSHL